MQPLFRLAFVLVLGAALLLSSTPAHAQAGLAASPPPSLDATAGPRAPAAADVRAAEMRTTPDEAHDALFHVVTGTFIVAASTDLSVSMYQIGRGVARERAFGAQWQNAPVAFAITKSALAASFVYGLQRMHQRRPKTAIALGIATTALEGWLTARSARIGTTIP